MATYKNNVGVHGVIICLYKYIYYNGDRFRRFQIRVAGEPITDPRSGIYDSKLNISTRGSFHSQSNLEGEVCWSNIADGDVFNPAADKCYRFNCKKTLKNKHVIFQTKENGVGIREMIVLTSECMAVNNKPCIFPATINDKRRVSCFEEQSGEKASCATEISDHMHLKPTETSECKPGCPGVIQGKEEIFLLV